MQFKTIARWLSASARGCHPRRLLRRRCAHGRESDHLGAPGQSTTPARPRPTPTCSPSASTSGRTSRPTIVAAAATTPAGQTPQFARNDDVNLAYEAANRVVNLTQPDQSRMVAKVAGGHNCWLPSPAACADTLTVWIRNWAGASRHGRHADPAAGSRPSRKWAAARASRPTATTPVVG